MAKILFDEVVDQREMVLIERLAREIWPEHYEPIIGVDQVAYMVDRFQSAAAVQEQIREGCRYFLIRQNDDTEGYFSVFSDKNKREIFLSKLYVRSVCRGQGLGRRAIDFVQGLAQGEGLVRITLTVNKKNAASIRFYEHNGFLKVGDVVKDIGSGFVMDDWQMEKRFKEKEISYESCGH